MARSLNARKRGFADDLLKWGGVHCCQYLLAFRLQLNGKPTAKKKTACMCRAMLKSGLPMTGKKMVASSLKSVNTLSNVSYTAISTSFLSGLANISHVWLKVLYNKVKKQENV